MTNAGVNIFAITALNAAAGCCSHFLVLPKFSLLFNRRLDPPQGSEGPLSQTSQNILFFLTSDRHGLTLAGTGVAAGALATNGQLHAVAFAPVAA